MCGKCWIHNCCIAKCTIGIFGFLYISQDGVCLSDYFCGFLSRKKIRWSVSCFGCITGKSVGVHPRVRLFKFRSCISDYRLCRHGSCIYWSCSSPCICCSCWSRSWSDDGNRVSHGIDHDCWFRKNRRNYYCRSDWKGDGNSDFFIEHFFDLKTKY